MSSGMPARAPQVQPEHYRFGRYESFERYASYWHQLRLVLSTQPQRVLELGGGSGHFAQALERNNVRCIRVDIDPQLADIGGDATALPLREGCVDVAAAFQVLEHLPFDAFVPALQELRRVARASVILSLPDARPTCRLAWKLPGMPAVKALLPLPAPPRSLSSMNREHHWEIGRKGFPPKKILQAFETAGLELSSAFRLWEHPYYHFFALRPRSLARPG